MAKSTKTAAKAVPLAKKAKAVPAEKKIKAVPAEKKIKAVSAEKKVKALTTAKKAKVALQAKKAKPRAKKPGPRKLPAALRRVMAPGESGVDVLDRLYDTIAGRKGADPSVSHSARLLSRGSAKVAQKFGEEAVECVIEAVAGNRDALIAESADVLYHLLVVWVDGNVQAQEVWAELERRQGVSGIAEKSARAQKLSMAFGLGTTKIP